MPLHRDESRFPLVRYVFPEIMVDADMKLFLQNQGQTLARAVKHATLFDMHAFRNNTQQQRQWASEWITQNAAALAKWRVGTANVASLEAAAMMRIVYGQAPPPFPWVVVTDMADAMTWLKARFEENGITLPEKTFKAS